MPVLSPGTLIYQLYHQLWTKAVGTEGYDKKAWQDFGDEIEKACKPTTVLQSWLERIPIRMQSTLLLGLRGPDTHCAPNVKRITRWMRGVSFKPGNPMNVDEFMDQGLGMGFIKEKGPVAKELEFCSQHYYAHLMHALEVIAYRHSDAEVASQAFDMYFTMCYLMHVPHEDQQYFEVRLSQIDWPKGQPDTFEDAMDQLELFKRP